MASYRDKIMVKMTVPQFFWQFLRQHLSNSLHTTQTDVDMVSSLGQSLPVGDGDDILRQIYALVRPN